MNLLMYDLEEESNQHHGIDLRDGKIDATIQSSELEQLAPDKDSRLFILNVAGFRKTCS